LSELGLRLAAVNSGGAQRSGGHPLQTLKEPTALGAS
jgi:hypothetical protein